MSQSFEQERFKTLLTANDSTAQDRLGAVRTAFDTSTGSKKRYRYVQTAADTTVANGSVLGFTDDYGTHASSDADDFKPATNFLGVGIGAITASCHGWVQVGGPHSAVKLKTDVTTVLQGVYLDCAAATDGVCDTATNLSLAQYHMFSLAASNDTAHTIKAMIKGFVE